VRVLIVDDHPLFLEGIGMLVDRLDGVELVGRCDSGEAGIDALIADLPDVVVLDFQLGDMTGLDVLQHINEAGIEVRVLFVSGRLEGDDAYQLVEAGASGVIEKDATFDEIADAITRVARGETVLSPAVAAMMVRRASSPGPVMTEREVEVLGLVAHGMTNKEIAAKLFLSAKTVQHHVAHIYDKIDRRTRAGAAMFAMEHRLVNA
jgi:two-component system nitrate/nitrite response regulator NarL